MLVLLTYLIPAAIKLIADHFALRGSLDTLTQAQADAWLDNFTKSLPALLPTPEELEGQV